MPDFAPGAAFYAEFPTSGSTGAAVNADSLPVATVNHNGTDDSGFVLTVTNLDTGRYKITGTVPTSYLTGDIFDVSVAATIGGVAAKAVIGSYQVLPLPTEPAGSSLWAYVNDASPLIGSFVINAPGTIRGSGSFKNWTATFTVSSVVTLNTPFTVTDFNNVTLVLTVAGLNHAPNNADTFFLTPPQT